MPVKQKRTIQSISELNGSWLQERRENSCLFWMCNVTALWFGFLLCEKGRWESLRPKQGFWVSLSIAMELLTRPFKIFPKTNGPADLGAKLTEDWKREHRLSETLDSPSDDLCGGEEMCLSHWENSTPAWSCLKGTFLSNYKSIT